MLVLPSVNSMNYDTREDVPTDAILAQLLGRQLTVLIDLKPTPRMEVRPCTVNPVENPLLGGHTSSSPEENLHYCLA